MIRAVPKYDPAAPVIVLDIGNTHIGSAVWQNGNLLAPLSVATHDEAEFAKTFAAHAESCPAGRPAAVVIASVVPHALERIRAFVSGVLDQDALVVGENVALPIDVALSDRKSVGIDRVCAAAATYDRLQSACTVVDFGTAVTVDLVNAEGAFLGGAILPGLRMQLRALHEFTAQLPLVTIGMPELAYGRNTVEAVQTGVCRGLAGAVRWIVEGYATSLNHWPQVVATGGDLEFLAPHCDFLDTIVPHLTLRGVGLAYAKHLDAMGA